MTARLGRRLLTPRSIAAYRRHPGIVGAATVTLLGLAGIGGAGLGIGVATVAGQVWRARGQR